MNIEEIKRNAPEGATHYIEHEGVTYHIKIGNLWYEITPIGNDVVHYSWYHLLKPL